MSSFSRFQDINQKRGMANQQTNSGFILKGYPSILIKNAATNEELSASVVNRQEKDLAYIYTHIKQPIEVGSVWEAKGLKWLVSEEIVVIKDVSWRKYVAFLCNVQVNGHWGYFISSEKSRINVELQKEILLQSQNKPMLILGKDLLGIGDKFKIKDKAWMVQEKDNLDDNITYYTLVATTMSKTASDNYQKENDIVIKPEVDKNDTTSGEYNTFIPNEELTLGTYNGYFKSESSAVKIISLTADEVKFTIPFGVNEVNIYVKDSNNIIKYKYRKEV